MFNEKIISGSKFYTKPAENNFIYAFVPDWLQSPIALIMYFLQLLVYQNITLKHPQATCGFTELCFFCENESLSRWFLITEG
jgi:hypothetical protein